MAAKVSRASSDFEYKGKKIAVKESADKATITIDGREFAASRTSGMWTATGVHNPYHDLAALSRHIVDYFHLF
jgi:hypothetical protein